MYPKGNANTGRFQGEKIYPYEYESFEKATNDVDYIITSYNNEYPHFALVYLSPADFEKLNNNKNVA